MPLISVIVDPGKLQGEPLALLDGRIATLIDDSPRGTVRVDEKNLEKPDLIERSAFVEGSYIAGLGQ